MPFSTEIINWQTFALWLHSLHTLDVNVFTSCHGYRYVDRVAGNLKKLLESAEKMMLSSRLMVTRHQEAVQEEKSIEPKLDLIRTRTKELQRQVNIM